ncbi:MAG: FtsX-like permease family protein [Gemmatimonadota bacterium]
MAVRTEVELASVLPELRGATRDFDSRIDVWQARTLREHLADGPLAQPRTSALLLSGFGLAALLLAAIGLYGVMALAVRERTQELGIRNALGATAARLRWEVLRDALSTTVVGVGLGLGIALLVSRLLVGMLFQVSPLDPVTLAAVCAALLTVSVMAGYLPARQATKIEPMGALRAD